MFSTEFYRGHLTRTSTPCYRLHLWPVNAQTGWIRESYCAQTYAVCGCSMKMFQLDQVLSLLRQAGFSSVDCAEHDFDLMKLPVLFHDYPASYLVGNFLRNVMSPPDCIGNVSSRYLLSRTMKIFSFFLRNRAHYASGEFVAVKRSM